MDTTQASEEASDLTMEWSPTAFSNGARLFTA
jgi:hypothetical protein